MADKCQPEMSETVKAESSSSCRDESIASPKRDKYIACDDGKIKIAKHVASAYFKNIIGPRSSRINEIMKTTETDIHVPPFLVNEDIIITGQDVESIDAAEKLIDQTVLMLRRKMRPTHFLSLPLNSDSNILMNCEKFKREILEGDLPLGVHKSLFIEPETLHLTLHVMALKDEKEIQLAKRLLEEVRDNIVKPLIGNKEIIVNLSGISIMEPNPEKARVLYTKIKEKDEDQHGLLVELAEKIVALFSEHGFESSRPVNFHVTLMKSRDQNKFNASTIMNDYEHFCFGEQHAKEIQLNQMSNRLPKSYYRCLASINL